MWERRNHIIFLGTERQSNMKKNHPREIAIPHIMRLDHQSCRYHNLTPWPSLQYCPRLNNHYYATNTDFIKFMSLSSMAWPFCPKNHGKCLNLGNVVVTYVIVAPNCHWPALAGNAADSKPEPILVYLTSRRASGSCVTS